MNKANECTCPSGDGSLVHPCPAHPAVEQAGGDERASKPGLFCRDCGSRLMVRGVCSIYCPKCEKGNGGSDNSGVPAEAAVPESVALLYRRSDGKAWSVTCDPHYMEFFRKADGYESKLLVDAALAQPSGEVVVTKNESGAIVSVTRQDKEGRVLSVIAESATLTAQAEQAEAERPEGPTEDEIEAAGLGYPLHKEEAVKLWYSGFRSEVITVLEAWEAIGHDIGMNPDKGELLDSLRYMLEKCEAHDAALARVAELEKGTMYVEARQCDECQHGGINDSATGVAACHECDWTGPEPEEDRCPGCQRENCMAAACPQCGARYVLVASEEIAAPVAQAQHSVPETTNEEANSFLRVADAGQFKDNAVAVRTAAVIIRSLLHRPALMQSIIRHRIGLTPEYEGQWHADLYGEDGEVQHHAEADTPDEAVRAVVALAAAPSQAQHSVPEGWVQSLPLKDHQPCKPNEDRANGYTIPIYSRPVLVEEALRKLRAVLCDPIGNVVIDGSDGDREEVQRALGMLAAAPGKEVPQAWLDVQAERRRQITTEGWTPEHDDLYCAAELPRAAAAYILNGANDEAPAIWPFSAKWWKPRDARSNYMRAGALILAEIERLDRAAAAGKEVGHE